MALDGDVLGVLLKDAVDGVAAAGVPVDRDAMFKAMGAAIVNHIKTATVTITVASVSGVTPGPGTSGPGSGTATIS